MDYFGYFLLIGIALTLGLLSTRLMKLLKLPNVTGYLLVGIILGSALLGPYLTSFLLPNQSEVTNMFSELAWVSELALGFIAFSIGTSFKYSSIKIVGKKVIIITLCEALFAAILVIASLFLVYVFIPDIPISVILTLGAIACATAPAATLMIIKQYKAKGPVVNTLLPVVAFDDAVALIAFSILFSISKSLNGGGSISVYDILVVPLIEIFGSIAIGIILGFIIKLGTNIFKSRTNRLLLCITAILLGVGIAIFPFADYGVDIHFSSLLICLSAGATFCNVFKESDYVLDRMEQFTPPIYMLFFIISGASLDFNLFSDEGGLGSIILILSSVYIVVRCLGKWLGAYTGSVISKAEPEVKKYLGFTLFPQAGVAIGLATLASQEFAEDIPEYASVLLAVILLATIVYEILGPVLSKIALTKAGDIVVDKKKDKNA